MSERTEERSRESLDDVGVDVAATEDESVAQADDDGSYFSARALLFAFAAVGGGMALGSLVPIVPFTQLLGAPLSAFVYGLFASERRYLEVGIAGGATAAIAAFTAFLPRLVAFEGFSGVRLFAAFGGLGLVLAVVGHYFGRDLRAGLTKDL